ncbi:MAG: hypothetical protein ACP5N1_00185 [Candidatus Woesearchaeota archaeon]
MNKQPYQELIQQYKKAYTINDFLRIAPENPKYNRDTFEFEGEQYPYNYFVFRDSDVESAKSEYRAKVRSELLEKKTEEELLNLPCKEKLRRYSKNVGLELLALTLEAVFVPLMIGGISIRFNELRERKEETYLRFINQQKDITNTFGCR